MIRNNKFKNLSDYALEIERSVQNVLMDKNEIEDSSEVNILKNDHNLSYIQITSNNISNCK